MRNGRLLSIVAALAVVLVVVAVIAVRSFRASSSAAQALPVIVRSGLSHEEGCLTCHRTTRGVGIAHAEIGCSPCHLGDPRAREAAAAHRGMEVLAGDFATVARTCGASDCHPAETARVQRSLMARAPGILAVNRFAFGERAKPDGDDDDDDLVALSRKAPPYSNAESHARQLCASCHLSARKERAGDLGIESRGGGCAACHLGPPAGRRATSDGPLHPDVSAAVPERRCEGCHSRSGRIALSFHGKVELLAGDPKSTGALPDGRPTGSASADVHAAAGMTCIDCHTEREVMGDGEVRRHVGEGRDVTCEDCHRIAASSATDADREAVAERLRAGWKRRGLPQLPSGPPIRTRGGTPLWRTDRVARSLALATSGERRAIPEASPRAYHALPGHERLDCQACHSAWAPRCPTCHTRFDPGGEGVDLVTGARVRGRWIEESGAFGLGRPSLAVTRGERIGPFVPGMHLRIDGTSGPAIERTLWAPLDPHTTAASRACASCHVSVDAYPLAGETTRTSARLLDAAERERVARVGRCVSCHSRYDDAVYADIGASVKRLRGRQAGACKGTLE